MTQAWIGALGQVEKHDKEISDEQCNLEDKIRGLLKEATDLCFDSETKSERDYYKGVYDGLMVMVDHWLKGEIQKSIKIDPIRLK